SAFWFRGKVGIENPFEIIFRNTDTFVPNHDPNVIATGQIRDHWHRCRIISEIIAADPERPAVRHRLVSVDYEVSDDLTDLSRINFSRPHIGSKIKFDPAVTA